MKAEIIALIFAVLTTIFTTIAGIVIKHYYKKFDTAASEKERQAKEVKEQYERLLKEDQIRTQRNMILEEIDPFVAELTNIKQDLRNNIKEVKAHIAKDEEEFEKEISKVIKYHDHDKEEVDEQIGSIESALDSIIEIQNSLIGGDGE